jgi:hypothetical protein
MTIFFRYWIGAAILGALAMVIPVWLIIDAKPLEAALVGLPSILLLAGSIAATLGMLRKG